MVAMFNVLFFEIIIPLLLIHILLLSLDYFQRNVLSSLSKIRRFANLDPVWPSIYIVLNQRFDKLDGFGRELKKVREIIITIGNLPQKGLKWIRVVVSGVSTEWVNSGEKVEQSNTK